jgi:hypothetical protein
VEQAHRLRVRKPEGSFEIEPEGTVPFERATTRTVDVVSRFRAESFETPKTPTAGRTLVT